VQGYGFVNAQRLGAAFRNYGAPLGSPLRNGTFALHLTPGEYDLETRGSRPGLMGPLRPEDELSGLLHVSVGGAPISDLTIQLAPASVITGRILFDGQSPPPDNPQALRIALSSMPADTMCNQGRSEVFPDWTFRIDGAMGSCSIMPTGIGRWILRSARREDLNLLDQPVRLAPGQTLRDIEVVFTDRRTELVLDVTDEHGLPTRDFVALVFSRDRKRWTENSRFVRIYAPPPPGPASPASADGIRAPAAAPPLRPDVIAALPPGAYYAIALEDLPVEGSRDPAVLEMLASRATAITLAEGTPARVPLRREPALR
jgi:hypothetical protein